MKRVYAILCALTLCAGAYADNLPLDLLKESDGCLLMLDYSFTTDSQPPVSYSGTAWLLQPCFRILGNGTDVRCDGKALYIIDGNAREVYIQSPSILEQFIKENIGTIRDFKLGQKKKLPLSTDSSLFTFDTTSLDKSWVVTDLR